MNQDKDNSENFSTTSNSSSQLSPVKDELSVTSEQDTIHYLSPATSCRTLCEGDVTLDFKQFASYPRTDTQSDFLSTATIPCDEPLLQRTIAIIKPKTIIFQDVCLKIIKDAGFTILNQRTVHLTPEQAAELYSQYYDCPSFPTMVLSVSVEPILVLSLAALDAVNRWKSMIGLNKALPADWFASFHLRKRLVLHLDIPEALHASNSLKDALHENRFFFPNSILEPIIKDKLTVEDYCNLYLNPTILNGLVVLIKKKPLEPLIFLAEWLLLNNPFKPLMPYKYATAPT